jgi:hypothetical protein
MLLFLSLIIYPENDSKKEWDIESEEEELK